uniref:Uncharacterized protein n=1 Tax=Anopheles coluzzii TaxID=1518534 RepID=A0A6E8W2Z9_ANOCL
KKKNNKSRSRCSIIEKRFINFLSANFAAQQLRKKPLKTSRGPSTLFVCVSVHRCFLSPSNRTRAIWQSQKTTHQRVRDLKKKTTIDPGKCRN